MIEDTFEHWHDFFLAEAGAAAALAGLLFVAVSINLQPILAFRHLPTRAIEALTALLSVLIVATFALVPDQSAEAYGAEIAGTGVVVGLIQFKALISSHEAIAKHISMPLHAALNMAPPLPFIIGGGLIASGHIEGLYWTVPGVLLSLVFGLIGAWVLLVEIQR
jgi:modulator of FtsH protease